MNSEVYIVDLEYETTQNTFYRKVLYTSQHQQLVIMNIRPDEDIEYEVHEDSDQFIRIESGKGVLLAGPNKELYCKLMKGLSVSIPANTWHKIVNVSSKKDLKLYTIYSPAVHKNNHIDVTRP